MQDFEAVMEAEGNLLKRVSVAAQKLQKCVKEKKIPDQVEFYTDMNLIYSLKGFTAEDALRHKMHSVNQDQILNETFSEEEFDDVC